MFRLLPGLRYGGPKPGAMYLSDACTLPLNMAGLPGIAVPAAIR